MNEPVAFFQGRYCPASEVVVAADDLGFLQGVTVTERLRTFNLKLFHLDDHLDRLANSLRVIDLGPELELSEIKEIAAELIDRNKALLSDGDDLGLSLFMTPGTAQGPETTVGIQAYPLPFGQWKSYYGQGQSLTETGIRQVPASCWPPALKCRSRMHYYLADQRASQQIPGSRAVILDQDGWVSEASTANIVMFREDEGLISPPLEKILPGVSLAVLVDLAHQLGISVSFRDFDITELSVSDEILLCSTSPCVWPVTQLSGMPIRPGAKGPVFHKILGAWSELVGLDIAAQAHRFGARA